jgi:hypothetical protein
LSENTAPALRLRGGTRALYQYRASKDIYNRRGSVARGSDSFAVAGIHKGLFIPLPPKAGSPLPSTLMDYWTGGSRLVPARQSPLGSSGAVVNHLPLKPPPARFSSPQLSVTTKRHVDRHAEVGKRHAKRHTRHKIRKACQVTHSSLGLTRSGHCSW